MIDRAGWCYVSGLVSAQWERLMRGRPLLALLEADSPEDLRTRLRASLLFAGEPPGERPVEEIQHRFEAIIQYVALLSPDARIGDIFLLSSEWERFRQFAKAAVAKKEPARGPRPEAETQPQGPFEQCWSGELEDEHFVPFVEAAKIIRSELPEEGDRAGWIDRCLDACEAASLVRSARYMESEALLSWVRAWLRLRAALSIIRARRIGWDTEQILQPWRRSGFDEPGLTELTTADEEAWPRLLRGMGLPEAESIPSGSEFVTRLGRCIDDRVAVLASAASGMPFGPERVFAFLWALRCEAVNLQLALTAVAFGIPEKTVENELRLGYG